MARLNLSKNVFFGVKMTDVVTELNAEEFIMAKKSESNQNVEQEEAQKTSESPEEVVLEPEVSEEERLKAELIEAKDRLLRLAAEFENYKKVAQREQQNSIKFANENLILSLLPVIDNLEQAVLACKKSGDSANNSVLVGVEMVLKQLIDVLSRVGIEVFSALNLPFDPARHEAMGEQEDDTVQPGTVLIEYQKGYVIHGRLLRPARVVIAKKPKS